MRNGPITIVATAMTRAGQAIRVQTGAVLANADGVVVAASFAAYANSHGALIRTTSIDKYGHEWRHGAVTVIALPVIYSGRTLTALALTLPGANRETLVVTPTAPGACAATWSATNDAVANVVGTRLAHQTLVEPDGVTPRAITPFVIGLDENGNDLGLVLLNADLGVPSPGFRLDNVD